MEHTANSLIVALCLSISGEKILVGQTRLLETYVMCSKSSW